MTSDCGSDDFSPAAPPVDASAPPSLLSHTFDALNIDWKNEQSTRTPFHKNKFILPNDQWLGQRWGGFVQDISKKIPGLYFRSTGSTNYLYPKIDLPTKFLRLTNNNRITTSKRKVARKQIGDFLKAYYWPYFDVAAVNNLMTELLHQGRFRRASILY